MSNLYPFIKRMYETKRADGTYVYTDPDLDILVGKGYITEAEVTTIKEFEQV